MDETILKNILDALPHTDEKSDPEIIKARIKYIRSHIAWTAKEDQLLKDLYQENYLALVIAKLLQRSIRAVETRIETLRLTPINNPSLPNKVTQEHPINKDTVEESNQNQIHQVIRYWRNSLADADKMGVSVAKMKQGEQFPLQAFKNAQLTPEKIQRFFDEAEKKLNKKNKKPIEYRQKIDQVKNVIIDKLQVIIAPYALIKKHEHGKQIGDERSPAEVLPLWLVANLTKQGELIGEDNIYPWLDRKCLTPNEDNEEGIGYPIIGDVSQTDEFYTKEKNLLSANGLSWKALFSFAENLFKSILEKNNSVGSFSNQNYILVEQGYILPTHEISEVCRNILTTYDQYLFSKNKKIPTLLENFCSLIEREFRTDKTDEQLLDLSESHFGQMQNEYPLSKSQRISLSYLFDTEDNDIFTVHGPPGTGKTSLLLSVIASKWVEAAIQKKPPPILIAASTNNLAVTNILDNFNQAARSSPRDQSIRWLPNFNSYGLYLAPSSKAKEAEEKNYLYRLKGKNSGSIYKFYNTEYRWLAKIFFLEQFNSYYDKAESDIKLCQDFIHNQMLEKNSLLQHTIKFSKQFYEMKKDIRHRYSNIEALDDLIVLHLKDYAVTESSLKSLLELKAVWFDYKSNELFWLRIFSWFPVAKAVLKDKITLFTLKYSAIITTADSINSVDGILEKDIACQKEELKRINDSLTMLRKTKNTYDQFLRDKITLEKQLGFEWDTDNLFDFWAKTNLLSQLDTSLRYELFRLATHYWEAAWLLKSETIDSLRYDKEGRKQYWQLLAMLTPCFVTTLHTGPAFFQYKAPSQQFETLANFIDLLIIDEAGQVMPAIGGAMISIAKKALLVGDAQQIEPIFTLPEGIDLANTKKFGLCADEYDYERLKNLGILCSGEPATGHAYGNVIVVGQRKAKYHIKQQKFPGMLLKEHRRCAKEIISYCNELCYDNQLIPMTPEKYCDYPRMGYAHIKGLEEKNGDSRFNKYEAEAIAIWIAKNKNKILAICETKDLDDCLGIVTPFAPQGEVIRTALYDYNLDLKKAGTIHSLQGAEKPIIIFSPVYTAEKMPGKFFFDRAPNMLNVAISRAKMAFLVFGDMDIFDPHRGNQPSSLLAKYLFAKEDNELVDIKQLKFKYKEEDEIQQINSLESHRRALTEAFMRAESELTIVSPFLRVNAIQSDSIPELISQYSPNISINIYTDPTLNKGHFDEFKCAKEILEVAGAKVILVNKVHSKIIAIDDQVIIEGSFNWLSASRIVNQFEREESSIIYSGKHVSRFIQEAINPIIKKAMHFSKEHWTNENRVVSQA